MAKRGERKLDEGEAASSAAEETTAKERTAPTVGLLEDSEAPAVPLDEALEEAEALAEGVLKRLPPTLPAARRMISLELWTLPRPEETQLLARLAEDEKPEGSRRQFCRRLIALRVVADQELRAFWDGSGFDTAAIRDRSDKLREILFRLTEMAEEVKGPRRGGGLDPEDRQFLAAALKILQPKQDPIVAAVVLGPALANLLDWAAAGDLVTMAPSLRPEELSLFLSGETGDGPMPRPLRRTCLEVATAQWILQEDVDTQDAAAPDGDAAEGSGNTARARAHDHEIVHRVVGERLHALQASAARTGREDETELLEGFREALHGSSTRLAALVGEAAKEDASDESEDLEPTSIEIEGWGDGGGESIDSVIDRAIGGLTETVTAAAAAEAADEAPAVKTNWWRVAGLVGITAILATVAVLIQLNSPHAPPPPIEFSPSDATNIIALAETSSIGKMLYARVTPAWSEASDQDRMLQLGGLVRLATDRGFVTIVLIDETNQMVAQWTPRDGYRFSTRALASAPTAESR